MNTLAAPDVISSQDWPAHSSLSPDLPRRNSKLGRRLEQQRGKGMLKLSVGTSTYSDENDLANGGTQE